MKLTLLEFKDINKEAVYAVYIATEGDLTDGSKLMSIDELTDYLYTQSHTATGSMVRDLGVKY